MTIGETLNDGVKYLSSASLSSFIDTPALDAALILSELLQVRREELYAQTNENVDSIISEKYFINLERRRSGECIAYILGRKEFRGLDFFVNHHVLVPRPDTENLVEAALEYIAAFSNNEQKEITLLDLCTGSGAVGISIKKECPLISVNASDISQDALNIAAKNTTSLLGSSDAIKIIQSDLFKNISSRFNIIVSNPPYIPTEELSKLTPEVQREPEIALNGGINGLELINKIILQAPDCLFPGGRLFLEASPKQMDAISIMLKENNYSDIRICKDLSERERIISAAYS